MQLIEAEDGNETRLREIAEQYLVGRTRFEFSEDYEDDDEWCASFIFLIYICVLFFSLDFFLCGQFLRSIKTRQVTHNARVVVELRRNKAFLYFHRLAAMQMASMVAEIATCQNVHRCISPVAVKRNHGHQVRTARYHRFGCSISPPFQNSFCAICV